MKTLSERFNVSVIRGESPYYAREAFKCSASFYLIRKALIIQKIKEDETIDACLSILSNFMESLNMGEKFYFWFEEEKKGVYSSHEEREEFCKSTGCWDD